MQILCAQLGELDKGITEVFEDFLLSAAYSATYLLKPGSVLRTISLGNIMSLPLGSVYWNFTGGLPLTVLASYSSPLSRTKYWLLKVVGVNTHGPTYRRQWRDTFPERVRRQGYNLPIIKPFTTKDIAQSLGSRHGSPCPHQAIAIRGHVRDIEAILSASPPRDPGPFSASMAVTPANV